MFTIITTVCHYTEQGRPWLSNTVLSFLCSCFLHSKFPLQFYLCRCWFPFCVWQHQQPAIYEYFKGTSVLPQVSSNLGLPSSNIILFTFSIIGIFCKNIGVIYQCPALQMAFAIVTEAIIYLDLILYHWC